MIIRKGKISDLKELLKLLNSTPELQSTAEGQTYPLQFVKGTLTGKDRNLVLIAEENKKLIGFLTAELWKDKKYSYLTDIFVKVEYQKKGVASKLMKEYEKICKKYKMDFIVGSVMVSNKKMQNFVEKLNYKKGHKVYLYEKKLK